MNLSIIIPAYNEEERIGPMLDEYIRYFLPKYGEAVEIIVVINGSTDRTVDVVDAYVRAHRQVRCLVDAAKIGKGGAVMLGFAAASGDRVGFVDADGSTPAEAFDDLVEHIGDAGAIIASRYLKGARVFPRQPVVRRVASRMFNQMVRLLFKLPISDTQCGAKLLSCEAVQRVFPKLGVTRWAFDVDLLFQVRRAHLKIIERPTVWEDKAGSKLNIPRASCEMFLAIWRLRLMYSRFAWVVELYNRILGPIVHR